MTARRLPIRGWYSVEDSRGWEHAHTRAGRRIRGAYNPNQGIPRDTWLEALVRLYEARRIGASD